MPQAKILMTGFEPFGEVTINPSQQIVEHLAKQENPVKLVTAILPVDYRKAAHRIMDLIERHEPQAVLMLGVAQNRDAITLERIAVNINDASIPDNDGELIQGKPIVSDAPVGYWSTLPIEDMYTALKEQGIPVKFSNHAGAYLCNHVFYSIRHYFEDRHSTIPTGFIHVPGIGDESEEAPGMPLEKQIQAIQACIDVLAQHLKRTFLV
ncbi:MAG: pyroglutamyl-peptidase I [Anaerolineae bacterium]|nr:pyroglutamyl-peptidase I [Anaerolineae bacterium]